MPSNYTGTYTFFVDIRSKLRLRVTNRLGTFTHPCDHTFKTMVGLIKHYNLKFYRCNYIYIYYIEYWIIKAALDPKKLTYIIYYELILC